MITLFISAIFIRSVFISPYQNSNSIHQSKDRSIVLKFAIKNQETVIFEKNLNCSDPEENPKNKKSLLSPIYVDQKPKQNS